MASSASEYSMIGATIPSGNLGSIIAHIASRARISRQASTIAPGDSEMRRQNTQA